MSSMGDTFFKGSSCILEVAVLNVIKIVNLYLLYFDEVMEFNNGI